MGWFSEPPKPAGPKPTSDGAFVAPSKSKREMCYESRDAFFECLDRNNILDAIGEKDEATKACGGIHKDFEKNCASSWVDYFKKQRVANYKKEQTIKRIEAEGANATLPPLSRSR